MTNQEFKQAFNLAKDTLIDLSNEDISGFNGFGLPDFKPTVCTLRQVARLMRWQAEYMLGGWDTEALNEIRNYGRTRFQVLDEVVK